LLAHECLYGFFVQVGRVTEATANLLDLPAIAVSLYLVFLQIRRIHFL